MNVGDIFWMFRGEDAQLQVDAKKAGEAAAGTAAQSFGQKFGPSLKRAAGAAIGTGIGAAIGIAIGGANQLDAATRQLQADAGLTAEEAAKAQHAMAGMFRGNLQGFDEIGAAMARVHNDLGLTGEAADAATAKFLRFATATGQNAADSVSALDDILDNWGLTAADAQSVMDALIVSHQKFGGSIEQNEKTLSQLAPAMRAANLTWQDGVEILGLFGAKGLDAEQASAAFAKALTKVKSPDELQALITDIQNTTDPFERASKAADLFGARAGAKLANALGGAKLDDYAISATEAAGATEKAANAIESGFGNQFKLLLKNAGGVLAEFGTSFGPLLMVASAFGPKFLAGLTSSIGGVVGAIGPRLLRLLVPQMATTGAAMGVAAATAEVASETTGVVAGQAVVGTAAAPAAAAAGTGIGTAMGIAAGVAAAAAIGIGIALAFKAIVLDPALQQQSRDIGFSVGREIVEGTTDALEQSKGALEKGIADINALPLGGFLYGDQVRDLQAQLDKVNAKILRRSSETGEAIPESLAAGVESAMPVWSGKVEEIVSFFGTRLPGVNSAARQAGADGMLALAAGITSARQAPVDAFDTLKEMMKHAFSTTGEIARLKGQLASKALANGLHSGDPAVRAQATAVAKLAADRLGELAAGGGKAGKAAMTELNRGIRSKLKAVRDASLAAKNAALEKLNATKAPAATAGTNAGQAFAAALRQAVASGDFHINASVGFTIPGHAKGGPIVGPSWVGEEGAEIYVPPAAGRILSHEDSMAAVAAGAAHGGGTSVLQSFSMTVQGALPVRTIRDISREQQRISSLGRVPASRLSPTYRREEASRA